MVLNTDAKFERKLTRAFKNDTKNFHQSMFESLKLGSLVGSFQPKQKMYELKIYREVMCYVNEE